MHDFNLNCLTIDNKQHGPAILCDHGTATPTIEVFFRNIEQKLIEQIKHYPLIVGCVAWLTNQSILDALAACCSVSIVVQKEDFLRPDLEATAGWKNALRRSYDALRSIGDRQDFPGLLNRLSYASDGTIAPVRCVGNHNRDRKPAFPRMHNKFVVFCDWKYRRSLIQNASIDKLRSYEDHIEWFPIPRAVWTGSFNFTRNASFSLENAVLITDPVIAGAYFAEWEQTVALSEPLDWEDDWCAPEWRIGS